MSVESLKREFGGKTSEAINRAIRQTIPGGDQALDALTLARQIAQRRGWTEADGSPSVAATLYKSILKIVDEMEAAIRADYKLPPRPPRDPAAQPGRRHTGRRRGGQA